MPRLADQHEGEGCASSTEVRAQIIADNPRNSGTPSQANQTPGYRRENYLNNLHLIAMGNTNCKVYPVH
eukprot:scaffold21320_cov39-Cyclotella_meneghiniana.AAC.3